ncbi:glycoside hydrolase family 3 C-terminal domain-containing protein [Paenibacillus sp. JNUCC31]|uniref:beta-glucosidase n=1 Tax=Paenibacillus sp. JNUCC-31 TaxID=2777983 RepID=UPI0017859D60|nr:beta-glucosidase [Paenibacillus sp. JNUCC-31]QOS76984.1 glycoside hydrolase family 3 C-terminal domain-containing protein [Paenibacillus sp. JNUCC-31]
MNRRLNLIFLKRWFMLLIIVAVAAMPLHAFAAEAESGADRPWMNKSLSAEERTALLLKAMTLEEKVGFVTGKVNNYYGFYNDGLERLGIPALQMADGPAGVRVANPDVQDKKSTALPAPIALAASWDTDLAKKYGDLIGQEAHDTTHNVVLGPGLDIARTPWGSRNFESLGEDPLLASGMGAAYVNGIQSNPVIATAKHYILNNQETERFTTNATASERAIQEVYARPFQAMVEKANLGSAMCSFNQVNGTYACENKKMLTDVLKNQFGFEGFVMSDYGANFSTAASANAGLDLETPGEPYGKWGSKLLEAVNKGEVSEQTIDEKVRRILLQMFEKGLFDNPVTNTQINAKADGAKAREFAEKSMVLLQNNDNMLPLSSKNVKSIAVIGPDADNASAAGGGSSMVNPTYTVSPLQGIRNRAGNGVDVKYAAGTDPISAGDAFNGPSAVPSTLLSPANAEKSEQNYGTEKAEYGLHAEYWTNKDMEGNPELVRTDNQVNMNLGFYNYEGFNAQSSKLPVTPTKFNSKMSARWTGSITAPKTGEYKLSLTSLGSAKLYVDDQLLVDNQGENLSTTKKEITLEEGKSHNIRIEYRTDFPVQSSHDMGAQVRFGWEAPEDAVDAKMQKAVDLAKKSDVAVVVTRTYDSEGYVDRSDLELPNNQEQLIREVAAANPKTIVVQMSGRAVEMDSWQKEVPSIVQAWYAGQEQGNAVARVLFGDVNPSGKLPVTFPSDDSQTPVSTAEQFPGVNGVGNYSEGIFVGYKGYDKEGMTPAFAFGHGLSYTNFDYRNLHVKNTGKGDKATVEVSLNLRNTGKVTGAEVVQVYVGNLPTKVETPEKQLAGWAKVDLKAGKQQRVNIQLDRSALSYWDETSHKWVMPKGKVQVYVGSASDDIRLTGSVNIGSKSGK